MKPIDSYAEIFKDVRNILIVLAHPDDFEIVCGGMAARLMNDNKNIRLVVTTNGGKGSKDKKDIIEKNFGDKRVNEEFEGANILGVDKSHVFNLDLPDGEFDISYENIGKIVWHIRDFKPDIVITHNSEDKIIKFDEQTFWVNHRDHRNTGLATLDACYPYSRDTGFYPEQLNKVDVHTVNKLLIADSYQSSDRKYFDISNFTNQKVRAIAAHKSAIAQDDAQGYLDENKIGDQYFEVLRYLEIY